MDGGKPCVHLFMSLTIMSIRLASNVTLQNPYKVLATHIDSYITRYAAKSDTEDAYVRLQHSFGDRLKGAAINRGFQARRLNPIKPITERKFRAWLSGKIGSVDDHEAFDHAFNRSLLSPKATVVLDEQNRLRLIDTDSDPNSYEANKRKKTIAESLIELFSAPPTVFIEEKIRKLFELFGRFDINRDGLSQLMKNHSEDSDSSKQSILSSIYVDTSADKSVVSQRLEQALEENRPVIFFIGCGLEALEVFHASYKEPNAAIFGIDPAIKPNEWGGQLCLPYYRGIWGKGRVSLAGGWGIDVVSQCRDKQSTVDKFYFIAPNGNLNAADLRLGLSPSRSIEIFRSENEIQQYYNLLKSGGKIVIVTEFQPDTLPDSINFLRSVFGEQGLRIECMDLKDSEALDRNHLWASPQFVSVSARAIDLHISESRLFKITATK